MGASEGLKTSSAPDLVKAARALLMQWEAYQQSVGNMEEAYYKLGKYAYPHWLELKSALSKIEGGQP
jgi:hypothetical protein